jgi:prepilin-type N-terminal cleavage/methylation domain-containing protein
MKRVRRQQRGFSLLELIISMAIVIIAVSLAGAGFVAQNQALQASDLHRSANASIRDAMLTIEQTLRSTGWGVDPRFAIDLYSAASPNDGSAPGSGIASQDSKVAPDELTVIARNPNYQWVDSTGAGCTTVGGCYAGWAWNVISLTPGSQAISVTLATGQVLEQGRLIQIQCLGGLNPVILTVRTRVVGTGSPITVNYVNGSSFPYNDSNSLLQCHGQLASSGASLYVLDRSHYYVKTLNGDPWLMLDPTIDISGSAGSPDATIDSNDHIPLARNIEDMQVAYVLPTPQSAAAGPDLPSGAGNYVLGDCASCANELPVKATNATTSPLYTDPLNHVSRTTTASANVKGIRVSLIARSSRQDPNRPNWPGDAIPYPENRAGTSTPTGSGNRFLRFPAVTEISLRNMDSQRPFTF